MGVDHEFRMDCGPHSGHDLHRHGYSKPTAEMALTTINKAIDAGLITKEEFDEQMKKLAKELGIKSGTTGAKE